MADKRIGIYPGTFDPVTNGHVDIIRRAARLVDKLLVAVSLNAGKRPIFSVEERAALLRGEIADTKNGLSTSIEVVTFDSLLMHFAVQMKAKVIIRGLRAVSDFEYEFQMTGMNARLNPEIETVFLMASERSQFISSRFVKEIHKLGGDVSQFVSPRVVEALKRK
ncbi:MAG TPA: pantetheine-phosphate adenylyltransferase [Dongiaceae bacterium]|jgi:pantetheine-phosphate adenylyltransferase|nr:pantetheine-phosphate adenylyltransferase [Dongiaceae bacterium]